MIFRKMSEQDLEQVAAIELDLLEEPWTLEGFRSSLKRPEAYFIVAESDAGEVIGYCGCYRSFEEAEIVDVAIRRDHQGKGIGSLMVQYLIDHQREMGVSVFILEVRAGNAAAKRAYEKDGFEAIGVRKRFYSHPTEDAIIMRLEIEGEENA